MMRLAALTAALVAGCASKPPPAPPPPPPPLPVAADHWAAPGEPIDPNETARAVMGMAEKAAVVAACMKFDCRAFEEAVAADGAAARPERFRAAVAAIARQHGVVHSLGAESAEILCGGSAGPSCGASTTGLEIAKLAVPIAAGLYKEPVYEVATMVASAVTEHAVWHDAYGYAYAELGIGPGYPYAGCKLSSCTPDDPMAGQLDGILYQAARVFGVVLGPACGPDCNLGDEPEGP